MSDQPSPIFDHILREDLKGMMEPEDLQALDDELCEDMAEMLPQIEAAAQAGDAVAVAFLTHKLKGGSESLGVAGLARELLSVEQAARAGEICDLTALQAAAQVTTKALTAF